MKAAYVAPQSKLEQMIAAIWQQALKVEKVGVDDNFFDLGGHSLLATQIMFRLRDTFQAEIPLRTLFEKPTIEELALAVEPRLLEVLIELAAIRRQESDCERAAVLYRRQERIPADAPDWLFEAELRASGLWEMMERCYPSPQAQSQ